MPAGPKRKIRIESLPEYAVRIRELRGSERQGEFARMLGVSPMAVSHWETGTNEPGSMTYLKLAKIAEGPLKKWFMGRAESEETSLAIEVLMPSGSYPKETTLRDIPVLRDAVAAGTPRVIDEREIDYRLKLPRELTPRGGTLYGLKVQGDSMSPFLETGYVAIVDVSKQIPSELEDRMVAAREADAVTIKWLRREDEVYMLVPQNTSLRHPVRIIREGGDFSIVGAVVSWVGQPPEPAKRKGK